MVEVFTEEQAILRLLAVVNSPGTKYRRDRSDVRQGIQAFERHGSIYTLYLDMNTEAPTVTSATIEPAEYNA